MDGFERPRRSSSMIMNPGGGAPPQPSGGAGTSQAGSQQPFPAADEMLHRTTSTVTLEGMEPRMFPGVVSRRRRSSMRSSTMEDGEPAHSGFRRGDAGSVVEEKDTDDEDY